MPFATFSLFSLPIILSFHEPRIVFLGKKPSPSIFLVGRGRTEKDRESVAKSSAEILFSNLGGGREVAMEMMMEQKCL